MTQKQEIKQEIKIHYTAPMKSNYGVYENKVFTIKITPEKVSTIRELLLSEGIEAEVEPYQERIKEDIGFSLKNKYMSGLFSREQEEGLVKVLMEF